MIYNFEKYQFCSLGLCLTFVLFDVIKRRDGEEFGIFLRVYDIVNLELGALCYTVTW